VTVDEIDPGALGALSDTTCAAGNAQIYLIRDAGLSWRFVNAFDREAPIIEAPRIAYA